MQLIECPWCGPREETEFHYGGEAGVAYPADPQALSDTEWAHFVFFRNNPKGTFHERWSHAAGCRRWFDAVRDTVSYRFVTLSELASESSTLSELASESSRQRHGALPTERSEGVR